MRPSTSRPRPRYQAVVMKKSLSFVHRCIPRSLPEVLVFETDSDSRLFAYDNQWQDPLSVAAKPDRAILQAGALRPEESSPLITR